MTPTQKEGLKKLAEVMEEYNIELSKGFNSITDEFFISVQIGDDYFFKYMRESRFISHEQVLKLIEDE